MPPSRLEHLPLRPPPKHWSTFSKPPERRFQFSGMSPFLQLRIHHEWRPKSPFLYRLYDVSAIPGGAHLRFQVVGGNFRDGTRMLFLPPNAGSTPPLKKITSRGRHFFGFGRAEILQILLAKTCARMCASLSGAITSSSQARPLCRTASSRRNTDFSGGFGSLNSLNPCSAMARVI